MNTSSCECGCGQPAPIAKYTSTARGWRKGQPVRFIHGHNAGLIDRPHFERMISTEGYVLVYRPEHAMANHRGWVLEHRLVVSDHIGRTLLSDEVVHHINQAKTDNRLENLQVMPRGVHIGQHARERGEQADPLSCNVDGCPNVHYGRGMCRVHWKRWWRNGDPLLVKPAGRHKTQPDECIEEGCGSIPLARGRCQRHWRQLRNLERVGASHVVAPG